MKLLIHTLIAGFIVLCLTATANAQLSSKQVSDVKFITTENGTRIQLNVSGPVQLSRKQLKGYVAFTVSPAKYVLKTNQISVQNPFVEFIYAVQRTDQDVYVLIKLKKTDQVITMENKSGEGEIIIEILDRPLNYPAQSTEKMIPSEKQGAPFTPESELS